jgi:iron complex outermembrane recepter protein
MKKMTLLLIALIFVLQNSIAQNKMSGTIIDAETKEILIGASINISELKTITNTDLNGFYTINNIKNGKYLFESSFIGYKPIIKNITISADTSLNFRLAWCFF